MDRTLRQSLPARISAIGFIVVVAFGNLWLVRVLLGQAADLWIVVGFVAGIAIALGGGLGLLMLGLYRRFAVPSSAQPEGQPEGEA